jgi:SAM-dependent methyltransferase
MMAKTTDLLTQFISRYPAQPATAFWRSIEIEILAKAFDSEGLGLDLGCGDGILTDILFKRIGRKPNLVGIDLDPLETAVAASYPFYASVHACSARSIPLPNGSFDYVISNSVLEHIPDLKSVIAEVRRLLKPGGRFYFTVPAPSFHDNLWGNWLPGSSREDYLATLDLRLAHLHYLSESDWSELAKANGLVIESTIEYLTRFETRRWENLARVTSGLLYRLSFRKFSPLQIQRGLKLRSMQNRMKLPLFLSAPLAHVFRFGVPLNRSDGRGSCLLVIGCRPA